MSDQSEFYAFGYRFAALDDVKQAQLEHQEQLYFETRLPRNDARKMLAVYDKVLDEKIFVTPVGWSFLLKMQEELRMLGVEEEKIRPIPLYGTFTHNPDGESRALRQRITTSGKQDEGKGKIRLSLLANVILCILVIAMFVISLNGSNPNILNYKHSIENEYAAWEQELTDRERVIRQKEAELLVNPGAESEEIPDTDGKAD